MNNQKPKVSICIPTYKELDFLKRALDSVLSQTYADYEIIVSDDTPDNSVSDLLNTYDFSGKLKYFKNKKSLGSPENWNESIRLANGEYIKILHHDDWFTFKYSLAEYVKMLDENPESDFAFSGTCIYHADTLQTRTHCITENKLEKIKKDPLIIFFANHIGAPSATIFRRSANKFFDIKMKWLVDMDFYIRILSKNPNIAFSKDTLITTVTAAPHTVTNDCHNNKEVNIFEYLHLFQKIKSAIKSENLIVYKNFIWELFQRFKIKSEKDIRKCGYTDDLPKQVKQLLYIKLLPPFFRRMLLKRVLPPKLIENHPYYSF